MKDKEKQIDNSWRAKMVEKGLYKDTKTTSKEKQIEEMAKEICIKCKDITYCSHEKCTMCYKVAEELISQGYRKLLEDSVVLSREEYRCLKSIEKSYDPFWFCAFGGCEGACKECKDTCEMSIFVKERKETAEKYKVAMMLCIQEMQKYLEITEEQAKILYQHNADIAKQLGVEIKE